MRSKKVGTFAMVAAISLISNQVCVAGILSVRTFTGDFSKSFESFPFGPIPGSSTELSDPVSVLSGQGILAGVHTIAFNPTYLYAVGQFFAEPERYQPFL